MTKKKIILTLVGLLVLGGLAGIYFAVSSVNPITTEDPDNDVTLEYINENAVIYKGELSRLDYLQIENSFGSYRVRKNALGDIEIVGREGVPLFPYSSQALYSSISQVKCLALIQKQAETLSDYGLENPSATVSAVEKDGKVTRFYVGDPAPMGDGYYIRMENSRDIYLVANTYAERYIADQTRIYSNVLSKPMEVSSLTSFSLTRDGEEISLRKTQGSETSAIEFSTGFILEKPIFCGADSSVLETVCESLKSLKAEAFCPEFADSDEVLAKYGLDTGPVVTISAAADTTSLTLSSGEKNPYYGLTAPDGGAYIITSTYRLGKVSEGKRYVMYDDSPVIYTADASAFDFVSTDVYQFCQRLVNIRYLSSLSGLTLSFDGEEVSFAITHGEENAMTVTRDYAPVDSEKFRSFYVDLVSVTHTGLGEKPQSEPLLTIRYTGTDGGVDVLEFLPYPENPRKVFICLNGEGVFVTAATQAEKIKTSLQSLLS